MYNYTNLYMSLLAQIALGVLVAGGIGWGVWSHSHKDSTLGQDSQMNGRLETSVDATLTTGTTNTDLDKDLSSIDSQLKLVSENEIEADNAMNQ